MFDAVLKEFAQRIGIGELPFSADGVARLDVAEVGMVFFERQFQDNREELLVYMAKPYDTYDSAFARRLLEFCSYENGLYPPVYGSLAGGSCILGLRFSEDSLYSGTDLENSVYYLQDLFLRLMQQ